MNAHRQLMPIFRDLRKSGFNPEWHRGFNEVQSRCPDCGRAKDRLFVWIGLQGEFRVASQCRGVAVCPTEAIVRNRKRGA